MRTAESIINEYLAQGYSLESLRVLAESRSEPIRSEMLARIEEMRSGPSETHAATSSQPAEALFFVAADEESVGGVDALDFDIMARTDSVTLDAVGEESVTEIVVGETNGSEVVAEAEECVAEVMVLESGVNPEPVMESVDSLTLSESPEVTFCEEIPSDIMVESSEILTQESASSSFAGLAVDGEASDYMPGTRTFIPESEKNAEALAEVEAEAEVKTEAEQEDMVAKAQQALLAAQEAVTNCLEDVLAPVEEAPMAAPIQPEEQDDARHESRRERRRRARAQKRKKKQPKHIDAEMSEIVMTHDEGAETPIPEMAEMVQAPSCDEMSEPLDQKLVVAEAAAETPFTLDEPEAEPAGTLLETDAESLFDDVGTALTLAVGGEQADPGDGLADHTMILANGGLDFRSEVYPLLMDEDSMPMDADGSHAEVESETGNVILFRKDYELADLVQDADDEVEDEVSEPVLHLLNAAAPELEVKLDEVAKEQPMATGLSPMDRLGLLRALVGAPEPEECTIEGECSLGSSGHVIVTADADPVEPPSAEEITAAVEKEYQGRVDNLAQLMLEVQGQLADAEQRCRTAHEEIGEREGDVRNLKERLSAREKIADDLAAELAKVKNDGRKKDERLTCFEGMHLEHERLYGEFEDLRKAYNEVVTDVMPGLQNERDELALTVERQGVEREELTRNLGSVRRRVAVSYALSAAACLMLVALPVMNWLRADGSQRGLALNHQQSGELVQRLEKAEILNVEYDKAIYNLSYQVDKMAEETEKLRHRNTELAKLAEGKGGRSGSPTRASTMALAGPQASNGKLQRNDVRDPGGNIDRVVARNREIYDNEVQAPIGVASNRVPVSAVAVNAMGQNNNGNLKPPAPSAAKEPAKKKDEVLATVKSGEGVAQVVYRVLGTRDPEVIAWVIRENKIKNDKRGNPRIYPDQKLRLPQNSGSTQSASAARR